MKKGAFIMNGLKMTTKTLSELRASSSTSQTSLARLRDSAPYVWDGKSEEDRPLSKEEMLSGIAANRQRRGRPGRPLGSDKESTTIRFDRDILTAFKDSGPGWQTRMNAALRDWLKTHSATGA
jgi:uncharacterized protein (DUF4415 family)